MAIIGNCMSEVSTDQNYFISLFTQKRKTARFQLPVCNICLIFFSKSRDEFEQTTDHCIS